MKPETKLALAIALRASMYDVETIRGPDLKAMIVAGLEDWFANEPVSSEPFDAKFVLPDVEAAHDLVLLHCLGEMGFVMKPADPCFSLDADVWETFCQKYYDERRTACQ